MIDPLLYQIRKERRERIKIIRKVFGLKPGDGKHLRYEDAFEMPDEALALMMHELPRLIVD